MKIIVDPPTPWAEKTRRPPRELAGIRCRTLAGRLIVDGHPFLVAAAVVISRFNAVPSAPSAIWRPLLVTLAATAILLLTARVLTRDRFLAALVTSVLLLFSFRETLPAVALLAALIWAGLMRLIGNRIARPTSSSRVQGIARVTAIMSAATVLVTTATVAVQFASGPHVLAPSFPVSGTGGPNVYILMLDGYPRTDTLATTFEFDNGAFLSELESRGFDVAEAARSNYGKTWVTLGTMFNGTYVDDLLAGQNPPPGGSGQIRWLGEIIGRSAMLDPFRTRGYRIATIPSSFTSAALTTADDTYDSGAISELEANILNRSPWSLVLRDPVATMLARAHADAVRATFRLTAEIAESRTTEPMLVFAHVLSPHTPFVVHEQESTPTLPACFPSSCSVWSATMDELGYEFDQYRDGFLDEVVAVNALVLDTADRVIAADSNAVVIVMSDHGSRYTLDDDAEHFRSFFAARVPGSGTLFPDDESPVNVLRRLGAQLFDIDTEALPFEAWLSEWCCPLTISPYDPFGD